MPGAAVHSDTYPGLELLILARIQVPERISFAPGFCWDFSPNAVSNRARRMIVGALSEIEMALMAPLIPEHGVIFKNADALFFGLQNSFTI